MDTWIVWLQVSLALLIFVLCFWLLAYLFAARCEGWQLHEREHHPAEQKEKCGWRKR